MSKQLHPAIFAGKSNTRSPFSFYGRNGESIDQATWQFMKDNGDPAPIVTFIGKVKVSTFWTGVDHKPSPRLREILRDIPFIWETVLVLDGENTYVEGYPDEATARQHHEHWVKVLYAGVSRR